MDRSKAGARAQPMSDMPFPSPRRAHCGRCGLPVPTCVCALAACVDNATEVLVLQHPDEARQAKGSARLLRLSLARCRVVVGETFETAELLALLDGDVSGNALVYPLDTVAGTQEGPELAPPRRLVVLDGTWRKSVRMLHANPLLQTLPRWSITPSEPSRYAALRKAPRPAQLSTLEATCAALAQVEQSAARYAPLLAAFERFVAQEASRAPRGRASGR